MAIPLVIFVSSLIVAWCGVDVCVGTAQMVYDNDYVAFRHDERNGE